MSSWANFGLTYARVLFGKIEDSIINKNCTKIQYNNPINNLNNKYYISNLIEQIGDISDRTYESSSPFGSILFINKDLIDEANIIEYAVKFKYDNKIGMDNSKMIRKLLEITNKENGLYLISNCESVLGLGKVRWDQLGENALFRVDFNGLSKYNLIYICVSENKNEEGSICYSNDIKMYKYTKNLEIVEKKLISICFKNPKMEEEYTEERFKSILKTELFSDSDISLVENNINKIEKIVSKAREQKHGTMIVIADVNTVNDELKVLKKQATLIDAMDIEPTYIKYLTAIDGAIYLDKNAKCYAVGVILDGIASEEVGDASRGARYNSAYKYYNKLKEKKCVIVIISEDGMVDIVPEKYNEESIFALVQDIIDLIKEDSVTEILEGKENELKKINNLDYHLDFKIADEFYEKNNFDKAYEYYLSGLKIAENQNNFIVLDYYFKITYSSIKHAKNIKDKKRKLKEIKECINLHSKCISIFKENTEPAIFNNIAVAYGVLYSIENNMEYYYKQIENYTKAIELAPNRPSFHANRARTYLRHSMYKESLQDYIEYELIEENDEILNTIKDILDNNYKLINVNVLEYYKQRLKETNKNENNELIKMLEKYYSSDNNKNAQDEVASDNIES